MICCYNIWCTNGCVDIINYIKKEYVVIIDYVLL